MQPLIDFTIIYKSSEPERIYSGCPGIAVTPSNRLICTMNLMGYVAFNEPCVQRSREGGRFALGKVFVSDDKGETWIHKSNFPFFHARPFIAGGKLYILGHSDDIYIICSEDEGETWSEASRLTWGDKWHQTSANICRKGQYIYLVMEKILYDDCEAWPVSAMAPVLLRADENDELLFKDSWTFAQSMAFRDAVNQDALDCFGVPFFKAGKKDAVKVEGRASMAPLGWLETNVVQIYDKNHYWFDENTFYLFSRAHTGGTGYCALSKVVQESDGTMSTHLVRMPSGVKAAFLPMPGGHMRFHIIYDEEGKLYWLLSTQATDSMTRVSKLPEGRYNLPNNERNRLQLHFSKNCVDWCFASIIAIGEGINQSRHYASMAINGDDLLIVSRSGSEKAQNPHDVDMITFHRVQNFRNLVY